MADMLVLEASGVTRVGSSPTVRTKFLIREAREHQRHRPRHAGDNFDFDFCHYFQQKSSNPLLSEQISRLLMFKSRWSILRDSESQTTFFKQVTAHDTAVELIHRSLWISLSIDQGLGSLTLQ